VQHFSQGSTVHGLWTRLAVAAFAAAAITGAASCAALQDYSARVGRNACRSAGTCTVYDQTGRHEEPCWPTDDGPMAYPGDPGWPFQHGVCDTVEEMNAPWPEGSDAAHPITASTSAASPAATVQ
jgi:hypothetical protein